MKTFTERLNFAMENAGVSQATLASAIGVSQPSIWKLVTGKTQTSRNVIEIAKVLGVRPEWLASGDGVMKSDNVNPHSSESTIPPESEWIGVDAWDKNSPLPNDEVEVPFLKDIELAAGDGSLTEDDYNGYRLRFSKSILRRVGANTDGSGVLCFPARGNSMEPIIPDGTTVAIDIHNKKIIDGNVYAINQDGWKRIKMLYRVGPDRLSIRSYNTAEYPPEEVDMRSVEIIGRMFWTSTIW